MKIFSAGFPIPPRSASLYHRLHNHQGRMLHERYTLSRIFTDFHGYIRRVRKTLYLMLRIYG